MRSLALFLGNDDPTPSTSVKVSVYNRIHSLRAAPVPSAEAVEVREEVESAREWVANNVIVGFDRHGDGHTWSSAPPPVRLCSRTLYMSKCHIQTWRDGRRGPFVKSTPNSPAGHVHGLLEEGVKVGILNLIALWDLQAGRGWQSGLRLRADAMGGLAMASLDRVDDDIGYYVVLGDCTNNVHWEIAIAHGNEYFGGGGWENQGQWERVYGPLVSGRSTVL
jgi:hypothetical protein